MPGNEKIYNCLYNEPAISNSLGGSYLHAGLDRFDRVLNWSSYSYGGVYHLVSRLYFGYDRNSNRLWRYNVDAAAAGVKVDQLYTLSLAKPAAAATPNPTA
jgi:hypothetical protein